MEYEAKPTKRRPRPSCSKSGQPKAIRDKEPEPSAKEREEDEDKTKEAEDEDEEDPEFLGSKDVPTPPDSAELDGDDDEEIPDSEELDRFMEDSDEDADVFAEEFAVEKKEKDSGQAKGIPAKVQQYLEKLDKELAALIPKVLTEPSCCT